MTKNIDPPGVFEQDKGPLLWVTANIVLDWRTKKHFDLKQKKTKKLLTSIESFNQIISIACKERLDDYLRSEFQLLQRLRTFSYLLF